MSGRGITVDGLHFTYVVGKGTTVIRAEDGCVIDKAPNHELVGVTPDVYERGQWKRTSDGTVTPKQVAERIRRGLKHRTEVRT